MNMLLNAGIDRLPHVNNNRLERFNETLRKKLECRCMEEEEEEEEENAHTLPFVDVHRIKYNFLK